MTLRAMCWGALLLATASNVLSAGGIEALGVPAAAFGRAELRVDDCTYDHDQSALLGLPGEDQCCVLAPVALPDGAEVEALTVYFVKADAQDLALTLFRSAVASVQVQQLAVVQSNAFSPSGLVRVGLDLSIDHPTVDNSVFSYYLATTDCLDSEDHSLYSAIVSYSPGGAR